MFNCAQFASAQEEPVKAYTFSPSTSFGMIYGHAEEIVYKSRTKMLSQLLWDITPIFYDSLSLDFSRTQPMERWGFFSTLSLKIGLPGKSGKMEDRDWASVENTALTHYSIHDNVINELFFFDIDTGFSFPLNRFLLLKTYMAISYMRFSFTGQYGQGTYASSLGNRIYAPIDDNPHRVPFSGKVITYTQNWLIAAPGVSLSFFFLNHFSTELFFAISPLSFCLDEDQHLKTNVQYLDYTGFGLFIEPKFHFTYFFGKGLELSLEFSWRYIGKTIGHTYSRSPIGVGDYQKGGTAGAGLSVLNAGLCFKVRL